MAGHCATRYLLAGLFLTAFLTAGFADDAAKPKFTMTGELDLGVTYDSVADTTTDKPTELKLSPTLADGNVGFNSRIFFLPPTFVPSAVAPVAVSLDYAYGTYLLYGSLFDHFMTAKISMGDFADLTDYVLSYNLWKPTDGKRWRTWSRIWKSCRARRSSTRARFSKRWT